MARKTSKPARKAPKPSRAAKSRPVPRDKATRPIEHSANPDKPRANNPTGQAAHRYAKLLETDPIERAQLAEWEHAELGNPPARRLR